MGNEARAVTGNIANMSPGGKIASRVEGATSQGRDPSACCSSPQAFRSKPLKTTRLRQSAHALHRILLKRML